jgi:hypothetical protein
MAQRARQPRARQRVALGAGLHGGYVELETAGPPQRFRVRLADGRVVTATPDGGVDPELLRDSMRARRMVILVDGPEQGVPRIVGALAIERPIATRERGDRVTIHARELRLAADERLRLEAGPVAVTADESGKMRLEGDRLVIDMAALVKVLSLKVELP